MPSQKVASITRMQAEGKLSRVSDRAEHEAHHFAARATAASATQNVDRMKNSGGQPLAPDQQNYFERRLGVNLNNVRLYAGSQAQRMTEPIEALAAARGFDIYFSPRAPALDSMGGRRLLAHELAHVAQAARGQIPHDRIMRKPIIDQIADLDNDWRVLGALSQAVTGDALVYYLTRYGELDAQVIKDSSKTVETGLTGETGATGSTGLQGETGAAGPLGLRVCRPDAAAARAEPRGA